MKAKGGEAAFASVLFASSGSRLLVARVWHLVGKKCYVCVWGNSAMVWKMWHSGLPDRGRSYTTSDFNIEEENRASIYKSRRMRPR